MTDSDKKSSQNPLLKVVVVCLLILYVVLAGYLMYTNQNIGNTQLGYSSMLAENLTELQKATSQLVLTLGAIHDDQNARAALLNTTITQLQSRVDVLIKALDARAVNQDKTTRSLVSDVARTQASLENLGRSLQTWQTSDQQTRAALQDRLTALQASLNTVAQTVGGQGDAIRQQLQSELARVRQELGQTTQTLQGQARRELLSGLATDQLTRVNAVSADVDRTPAVARQVWERARLLAEMCRLETGLDENAKQLDAAATSLQEQLRTSIAAAVARQENRAVAAKDLKTARAAWIQAGTLLRYYPVETDQTSVAAYQALVLAHEGARQEIQRKFSSSPPSQP